MKRATHDDAVALHASAQRTLFLDGASASDQVVYQYDHSHDQQEMNQAGAATYTGYKTQKPKDQQDYKYCPQHDSHSPF
jgi:hypothetical protein